MKKITLFVAFMLATSPAFALTHKQKQEQIRHRHEHLHQLHKENKILQKWMSASEKNCVQYHGNDFHNCYIRSMKVYRAKSDIKFSPETEKAYRSAIKPPKHTIID